MSHCIQLYVHLNTFGPNFFNQSCSSHFKPQSLCQPKFEYSSNFWRKITAEGHGTEQHLAFFVPSARRFGRQSSALLRHVDDGHRRVLLLTRTPAGCVSSHRMLLQLEPEPLSPCLETAQAAGKAIGHRPCHRPVSSPLAPPLLGAVLHLSALPASAARALAWRIALRRLAPVVALLFNVSARPVASHCRHHPPRPTGGQPLHRAELLLRARAATSSSAL